MIACRRIVAAQLAAGLAGLLASTAVAADAVVAQRIVIDPALPPFAFRVFASENGEVFRIAMQPPGGRAVDLPWIGEGQTEPTFGRPAPALAPEDLDFDGYQDLLLAIWSGATGNTGHAVWLYEPRRQRFVANEVLWGLSNLRAHRDRRELTTFSKGGHAGAICDAETFRWIGREPVRVRVVRQEWVEARDRYVRTVSELREGRLQAVETRELRVEELTASSPCDWSP